MIDRGPLLLNHRGLSQGVHGRLRIGVAVASRRVPWWVRGLVEYLREVPLVDVLPFAVPGGEPLDPTTPPWLTARVYAWSRDRFDPFGEVELEVEAESMPGALDLIVWLAHGPIASSARFGAVTIRLGELSTEPPYWREVLNRMPTSEAALCWHATSLDRFRILRIAEAGTRQGWFFTRNAAESLVAINRMCAELALVLLADASAWKERALRIPELPCPVGRERRYPSNAESARFLTRQAVRSVTLRLQARGRLPLWFTALRRQASAEYEDIPAPRGTQMADPFLVAEKDRTWLFFEDVPAGAVKGRLSCMEVLAGGFSKPEVVMEKDHHLSYPCVVADKGERFMIPESAGARAIQLFRADRFPFEWQLEATLMEDLAAVDTTPFFLDGRWYFFTSTSAPFAETFLFWSNSLGGRWRLHPRSPVSSSVKNCRAAGHLFYGNDRLLRPTQDCSVRYGYGIAINEITRLTTTEFEERPASFIGPGWRRGLLGTHTINSVGPIEVIDGLRFAS